MPSVIALVVHESAAPVAQIPDAIDKAGYLSPDKHL